MLLTRLNAYFLQLDEKEWLKEEEKTIHLTYP